MSPPELRRQVVAEVEARGPGADMRQLIAVIREGVRASPRLFVDPAVKAWCGRRWRHLFLREAVEDLVALEAATVRGDTRAPRRRIAERYLAENAAEAWQDEQPDPVEALLPGATLLVCPGLLNGMLPAREFRDDLPRIEWRTRMRVIRSDSHPARGCDANVADILRALDEGRGRDAAGRPIAGDEALGPARDTIVIGYSKGAPDVLTALTRHPEIAARIKGLFAWAGAIGGSQVADDLAQRYQSSRVERHGPAIAARLKGFAHSMMSPDGIARMRLDEADPAGAIRDLTTAVRQEFLRRNAAAIDALDIPIFTFRGVTRLSEVPYSQRGGCRLLDGVEAQHDMQVAGTCSQLPLPMATELAVFRAHHWDLAYPAFRRRRWLNNTQHPFPKTAAIAAMVQLSAELGLIQDG